MRQRAWLSSAAYAILLASPSSAVLSQDMMMEHGEMKSDSSPSFHWGASGILFGSRQSPAIGNRTLTEGYLSQPMLMGSAQFPRYGLSLASTLNFEGLTLTRGELNPGISGEGYIDRRHPHTYLHEVVATWQHSLAERARVSVTAGNLSILGRTRWTVASLNLRREFTVSTARLAPFVEVARAEVKSLDRISVFDPATFYGSNTMWSLSAGLRFGFGMIHSRMGRYGAALPKGAMKMDDMDMGQ